MEGNVVKAAWVLGGSMLASVAVAGVGLFVGGSMLSSRAWREVDRISQRASDAVLEAPKNTRVALNAGEAPIAVALDARQPIKVGLDAAPLTVALDTAKPVLVGVDASKPIVVGFETANPIKVGFENKLPMSLRVENSLDEEKGTRAPLVLKLNP